jgi:hypothetical protein
MKRAVVPVAALAHAIHTQWRKRRHAAGWRFGRHDRAARTSPYLKPFIDFSFAERQRECWLALGDVTALAKACNAQAAPFRIDGARLASALPAIQRRPDDDPAILACGRAVHRTWRIVNLRFGLADARMEQFFDDLGARDRAVTIDNLRADMSALAAFAWPQRICQLTLERDMLADRQILERLAAEAERPLD